jgi:serine protease Do
MNIRSFTRTLAVSVAGLSLAIAQADRNNNQTDSAPPISGLAELKEFDKNLRAFTPRVMKATVSLRAARGGGSGSGVIVNEEGLILTAAHVTDVMKSGVIVIFPDGKRVEGKVLGADYDRDAAMVQITEKGKYPYVALGKSRGLRRNDWAIALGHAGGFDAIRTPPVRLGRVLRSGRFLETDAAVVGGDSGGPLFNEKGELIGIHSNIGASLSQNRHVPVQVYRDQWEELLAGKNSGSRFANQSGKRAVLGVQLSRSDDDGKGVLIQGVSENSPAEKAGLKAGDRIVEINGKKVETRQDLVQETGKLKAGRKVKLSYLRGEKTTEVEVKLVSAEDLNTGSDSAEIIPVKTSDKKDDDKKKDAKARFEKMMREAMNGGGELNLNPEDLEALGGMEGLRELAKEFASGRGGKVEAEEKKEDKKDEKDSDAGMKPLKGKEREYLLQELLERAIKQNGRLGLTEEEANRLGGRRKVLEEMQKRMSEMKPEDLQKLMPRSAPDVNFQAMMDALRPVTRKSKSSTVSVLVDDKKVCLGTVVRKDGWIITKNTEIGEGKVAVQVDGKSRKAEVVTRFPARDLALLKVDPDGLKPVRWMKGQPSLGQIVSAPSFDGEPLGVGLVSVKPRALGKAGFLGVFLQDDDQGVVIASLVEKGAAEKAGLKQGDRIVAIDGKTVKVSNDLSALVRNQLAGKEIKIKVSRDEKDLDFKATLLARPANQSSPRLERMNQMSGRLSERRSGFPEVLQHDIPMDPSECGGPLVDLNGTCLGINVSRSGRIRTYAIPASDLQTLLKSLGKPAASPNEVTMSREEINELRKLVGAIESDLSKLKAKLRKLEAAESK